MSPLKGRSVETPLRRVTRLLTLLAVALGALLSSALSAPAQDLPPAVNLTLSLDVREPQAWFEAYQDILATPTASPEALLVTIVPRTPRRSIALLEPKFSATMSVGRPTQAIRVVVKGKMTGKVALATLQAFLYSLYEPSLESAPNTIRLDYGLSHFTGELVELKTEER